MQVSYFVVDAFADSAFGGNPAGVCVLDEWLDDATMLAIAAENRLSETAFCHKLPDGHYALRWFTPVAVIDLCGHATFGTSYVLFNFYEKDAQEIVFDAPMKGYRLVCKRVGERIEMEFPRIVPVSIECVDPVAEAIHVDPAQILATERDLIAVLDDEAAVRNLEVDLAMVEAFSTGLSLYVTAPAAEYDYVARAFWPKLGIPEDPVCGSMQSALAPYWSQRLGKSEMVCYEPSPRGGTVWVKDDGTAVHISGLGRLYLQGTLTV